MIRLRAGHVVRVGGVQCLADAPPLWMGGWEDKQRVLASCVLHCRCRCPALERSRTMILTGWHELSSQPPAARRNGSALLGLVGACPKPEVEDPLTLPLSTEEGKARVQAVLVALSIEVHVAEDQQAPNLRRDLKTQSRKLCPSSLLGVPMRR
jgi:hypothetical protein